MRIQKCIGVAAIVLAPFTFGVAQACPSDISLRPEPPLLCAPPPGTKISPMGWQPGASVTVYRIYNSNGTFSPAQKAAIEAAYGNWNSRLNANLTFSFQDVPALPQNPQYPYSQWDFASDPDCPLNDACTHTGWCAAGSTPNGFTTVTVTNVMPSYSEPGYQLFAHEVGHTFGIEDCPTEDCSNVTTIMQQSEADAPNAPMSPHCCDSKLMYTMNGGAYGRPPGSCSPLLVQGGTTDWPGTAFLTPYPGSQTYASATFPNPPQSGDTIIAGCLEINYDGVTPIVSDNQGNGNYQFIVGGYDVLLNAVPVVLYVATQELSSQSGQFTVTCANNDPDTIDLFALEFADLGDSSDILDSANIHQGILDNPYNCGPLNTSAVNDLIMSIYNNASPDNPVGISPTLGTIPYCTGGQGGQCVDQNGQAYEAGGISTYTAMSSGQYTPAWNWGDYSAMSCASMALKVIGP